MGQIECINESNSIYSVMRKFPGCELAEYLELQQALTEQQTKSMVRQLCAALQHLQSFGIGHRDFTLENVLFDPDTDSFVLIDFGMCKKCCPSLPPSGPPTTPHQPNRTLTAADFDNIPKGGIWGKPQFIAPEVMDPEVGDINPMLGDIWALGVMIFAALTQEGLVDEAVDSDERFALVAAGRLAELVDMWEMDFLPQGAVHLMQAILQRDPLARLTIDQILNHPWILSD
jgi:serine/threonine protein kinase